MSMFVFLNSTGQALLKIPPLKILNNEISLWMQYRSQIYFCEGVFCLLSNAASTDSFISIKYINFRTKYVRTGNLQKSNV